MRIGELTRSERLSTAMAASAAAARSLPGQLRRVSSSSCGQLVTPPDSKFAMEVAERAADELAPEVLAHSLRCFQWAAAFAEVDGLVTDPEQLWATTMLHDLALGGPDVDGYGCFAAIGGSLAGELVARHRSAADADIVRSAIAVHFHPATPAEPVARCLHSAVNLDVVGRRSRELDAGLIAVTEAAHSRDGFTQTFCDAMKVEAQLRPYSSAAVLWRAGARLPILLNPLARA